MVGITRLVDEWAKKAYNASMQQHGEQNDAVQTDVPDTDMSEARVGKNPSNTSTERRRRAEESRKKNPKNKRGLKIVLVTTAILILLVGGAVFAFPRLDAYLLERAERAEQERQAAVAQELEEDEFVPIAERVIEDVRSNIYRPRSVSPDERRDGSSGRSSTQTGESFSATEVVSDAGDGASASVSIEQEIIAHSSSEVSSDASDNAPDNGSGNESDTANDLQLDPFGLLFLMREAVISYDDAGEYAREGRFNTSLSYLREAELLFTELIEIIDEGAHTLEEDERRGAERLRRSAQYFLSAQSGAQQFVQGIEPDVDIAAQDARARAELREARALLEA